MKTIKYTLILIAFSFLAACSPSSGLTQYRETTFDVGFNTPFTLVGYTHSEEEFLEYFEAMKTEIRFYNSQFDTFKNYEGVNNLKVVNDMAGLEKVSVDPSIIELLEYSKNNSTSYNELFDPTMGAVLEIWHEYRERGLELNRENKYGPSPSQEILEDAAQYIGWDFVDIDSVNNTVYLTNERVFLDVGAIAKGWAVEKVTQHLEELGLTSGIVNGGGNIRLIGAKNNTEAWNVGVTNPDSITNESIASLHFDQSMSVVTSGDYERFFIDDQGNFQNHLINPRTLQPARFSRSVTVTVKDSGLADLLSTVFSMVELEEAKQIETELNMDDLGIMFIKKTKQDETHGYHYMEVDNKHIYYNDVIKNALDEKK